MYRTVTDDMLEWIEVYKRRERQESMDRVIRSMEGPQCGWNENARMSL